MRFYARVNGDYLDCYDWEAGDRLRIMFKVDELDPDHDEYLYQVFNMDKYRYAAVATYQMISFDRRILDMPIANRSNYFILYGIHNHNYICIKPKNKKYSKR